jgi:SprT protein
MSTVKPITSSQQQQLVARVSQLLLQCEQQFNRPFKMIDIYFDLSGRTSAMYVVRNTHKYFRFNPYIFAKYFNDGLASTVPHEVAHYVTDILFGIKNIRPHGKQWRSVMHTLGVEPRVTGDYDLSGVPVKRQRRLDYSCDCMTHSLTMTRHNKILKSKASYYCQKCAGLLKLQTTTELS